MKSHFRDKVRSNATLYRMLATPYHFIRRAFGYNTNEGIYLYFEEINAVFIALPKNANSAINEMFFDTLGVHFDKANYQDIHTVKRRFSITKRELVALRQSSQKPYTFAFVRNPYERLASCWENKINEEDHDIQFHYGPLFKKHMPFALFARRVCNIPDRFSDIHFRSQYSFLYHNGKPLYDYLGTVEKLQDDLKPIIKRFELQDDIPGTNMSDTTAWRSYYTNDLAHAVHKRYAKDFEQFMYGRDTFRE